MRKRCGGLRRCASRISTMARLASFSIRLLAAWWIWELAVIDGEGRGQVDGSLVGEVGGIFDIVMLLDPQVIHA